MEAKVLFRLRQSHLVSFRCNKGFVNKEGLKGGEGGGGGKRIKLCVQVQIPENEHDHYIHFRCTNKLSLKKYQLRHLAFSRLTLYKNEKP